MLALLLLSAKLSAQEPGSPVGEPGAPSTWAPLRVRVECQSTYRVDACTVVHAKLRAAPVIALVPRSDAELVLYVNATGEGGQDLVHLRVVSSAPDLLPEFQLQVAVDSRAPLAAQEAVLEPALLQVLVPFFAQRLPAALSLRLIEPPGATDPARAPRPWGLSVWLGGWGSWSEDYQSLSTWYGGSAYALTAERRAGAWVGQDRSIERQPSLNVQGQEVALSTDSSELSGGAWAEEGLGPRWSTGVFARAGAQDPEGQYQSTVKAHLGLEHDWFPSNDPRGNQLAVALLAGGMRDHYNQVNALGETVALVPTAMLLGTGSVRLDQAEARLNLGVAGEVPNPLRRYSLSASGDLSLRIGGHVDMSLSLSALQQAIPGPALLDRSSYEAVSRSSYAQPLALNGNLNLSVFWEPTNGAQNNRLEVASNLGPTSAF